jgi:flavin reductase (DIM6/NTAB) family NADH-FMN oxidoreductase RutF
MRRQFRTALACFPTGVVIVTAWDESRQRHVGMTMSSFGSVSLEPPLVLFCMDRGAHSLATWQAAPGYAINVLGDGQRALSERFARPLSHKWEGVGFELGEHNAPLLHGALAHFECTAHAQYDGGDHVIFLGRVSKFMHRAHGDPLVFYRSRYAGVRPAETRPEENALAANWPLPMHY